MVSCDNGEADDNDGSQCLLAEVVDKCETNRRRLLLSMGKV